MAARADGVSGGLTPMGRARPVVDAAPNRPILTHLPTKHQRDAARSKGINPADRSPRGAALKPQTPGAIVLAHPVPWAVHGPMKFRPAGDAFRQRWMACG